METATETPYSQGTNVAERKAVVKAGVEVPRLPVARRRYTKRQKASAVIAAEMSSQTQAAEATGIPLTTLNSWMTEPWAVELRTKTRADLADESRILAHRVLAVISQKLDTFSPRDLPILYGILVDKGQLLAGEPTVRTEITEAPAFSDQERELLADAIHRELAVRGET